MRCFQLGDTDAGIATARQEAAMTLSEIAARITGEGSMAKYTGGRTSPTRDEIARLAYHFYERRGRRDGHDVDDWLSAERELAHHYR
jgi:hypothetical protein